MAVNDNNLAERSGNLVESFKRSDPRILLFYGIIGVLLVVLAGGLGYQQLSKVDEYADQERRQNQRRVLFPGPRGNIYDRHGELLVGNNHRFAILLHLEELKPELRREEYRIYKNFVAAEGKQAVPSPGDLRKLSRISLVQRYLDQVNVVLGRSDKINAKELERHFATRLLLPYKLLDNLGPSEYARLIERLPVQSPLEVYAFNVRHYPHGAAASHTLGSVRPDTTYEAPDFPGHDLTPFKMPGTIGRDGLEKWFDAHLRGKPGGRIYRVDPSGYKIGKPVEEQKPVQGKHLITSLDIDLQRIAEDMMTDQRGAAVALDVNTGEVLVLASKPNYDLNEFSPRASHEVVAKMHAESAWNNLALNGFYPPGSTFKILTSIAALRSGLVNPDDPITDCQGITYLGGRRFVCDNQRGHHGHVLLREAIAKSCDIYYYEAGKRITELAIADEARRFHFDRAVGLELPAQQDRMIVPDRTWKDRERKDHGPWSLGDTYNMSIGQGFLLVTPLQMACFAASVARGEVWTQPTLVHRADAPRQRHESINLTPAQRLAIIEGMVGCTSPTGSAKKLSLIATLRTPGVLIAGKTGTAQLRVVKEGKLGTINLAWFICFAPADKPEIAMAVMVEGENLGENFGGGDYAAPIAGTVLKAYFEKKNRPPTPKITPFKAE